MGRNDRRRGRNNGNGNQKKHTAQKERGGRQHGQRREPKRPSVSSEIQQQLRKDMAETEAAIREFKAHTTVCELCSQPITDLASAMANRGSGNPVHFDCIIKTLSEQEPLHEKDRVTYIGNGKFAVLRFENPHDTRHFSIIKEIEWEQHDGARSAWREEMAELYSRV